MIVVIMRLLVLALGEYQIGHHHVIFLALHSAKINLMLVDMVLNREDCIFNELALII